MPSYYPTHPLSPPLSGHGAPYLNSDLYPMTPAMPYVPLPPCDHYHPQLSPHHHGLLTPPPSPARVHPALSAASTVVRYDFTRDPQTVRMSSSSQYPSFPSHDSVSSPSASVLYVRCEATGQMITVQVRRGAVTCLDLMVQLHSYFDEEIGEMEWRDVRGSRSAMKEAYEQRTGRAYSTSARMRRIDYLLGQTTFKRIVSQYGDSSWLLQTC